MKSGPEDDFVQPWTMGREYLENMSKRLGLHLVADTEGYVPWKRPGPVQSHTGILPYQSRGFDPVCSNEDIFVSHHAWFRDNLKSQTCNTQPRERALAFVLANLLPQFVNASKVHESSPNNFGLSKKLELMFGKDNYISSQFSVSKTCGEPANDIGDISLDLENQHCVGNGTFDMVITQDVFEHIYEPDKAFKEIERTLKPGGFHIFTVPLTAKQFGTFQAAQRVGEDVILYAEPEIHGNPMGMGGSLLTYQWGYDIVQRIESASGMKTQIVFVESEIMGVKDAEYREVLISRKAGSSESFPGIWSTIENLPHKESTKELITCTTTPV